MFKMESSEKEFEELLNEKRKELQKEIDTKVKNIKLGYRIFETIILLTGYVILNFTIGFWATLGIALVMWGNSLYTLRKSYKDNLFKEIFK